MKIPAYLKCYSTMFLIVSLAIKCFFLSEIDQAIKAFHFYIFFFFSVYYQNQHNTTHQPVLTNVLLSSDESTFKTSVDSEQMKKTVSQDPKLTMQPMIPL